MISYPDELDEFWTTMDEDEQQVLVDHFAHEECWDKWFAEYGEGTHGIDAIGMTLHAVASYMNDYDYQSGKTGDWIIEQVQGLYDEEFKERAEQVIEQYQNANKRLESQTKDQDAIVDIVAELCLKGGYYEKAGVLLANDVAVTRMDKYNLEDITKKYNAVQKILTLKERKTVAETQARWQQG